MLCEINLWGNFISTWVFINILALVMLLTMSGLLFYRFYVKPTYQMWRYKSNPEYPSPEKVRSEILTMLKGLASATLCPALTLYLSHNGWSKAHCEWNTEANPWWWQVICFIIVWIGSDFLEFYYHRLGHTVSSMWEIHKPHHQFFNPSPFAVIADEYIDQIARASPLIIFPLLMPINMDLIFFEYALFFYAYGVYLHLGYEWKGIDAHNRWINSSYQHYAHHAYSIKNKPYHTGFFFKAWDQMFGSIYDGRCTCAGCARERGERTEEAWSKIVVPDYSPLLTWRFWKEGVFPSKSSATDKAA